ncbi:hypothetical protein JXA59_01380 [Patescibacteria group bacterium]|nr:hypothetical protein [Patescibacteria group bacterium]
MRGDHIAFDNLERIGRRLGIPDRYHSRTSGQAISDMLIAVFKEIVNGGPERQKNRQLLAPNEVLVGVYKLKPGSPTQINTQVREDNQWAERMIDLDQRVVTCIEHPVHWAMIESRAAEEHYRLTELFVVDAERAERYLIDPRARKHLRPATAYKEFPSDTRLIEAQFGARPSSPATATATASSGKSTTKKR